MEAIKTHKWDTEHDTANRTMTHKFDFGFCVVVDWENMKLIQTKNGELKSSSNFIDEHLDLDDYEDLLLKTEKEVERLKCFQDGDGEN
jgi:hypothetical protein